MWLLGWNVLTFDGPCSPVTIPLHRHCDILLPLVSLPQFEKVAVVSASVLMCLRAGCCL